MTDYVNYADSLDTQAETATAENVTSSALVALSPSTGHAPQDLQLSTPSLRPCGTRRSPWGVWWLSVLTFGIYYCVWYYKTNAELRAFAPEAVEVGPGVATLSQFVPIACWISMANFSARLNAAHRLLNSPVRTSGGVSILASLWYLSNTRYMQRRLNALWDMQDTVRASHV